MTDRLRAAAQQALKAFEVATTHFAKDRQEVLQAREALRAALVEAREAEPPYRFDRYINGRLMAEGVVIERETTLTAAISVAARLASTGANGEAPVLVLVASPPPRREWVGLTDEERQQILDSTHPDNRWTLAERVEYRLKEKNA